MNDTDVINMSETTVLLAAPVLESAPADGLYAFILFGVLGVATLLWAAYMAIKHKNCVPLLLSFGGAIATLNEPSYDVLCKIIYNPTFLSFDAFGLHTPAALFLGYIPWVAAFPYWVYTLMQKGVSTKTLSIIALVSLVSVMLTDLIGISSGNWQYYGTGPMSHVAGSFSMGPFPIIGGWLLYMILPRVKGLGSLMLLFVPSVTLTMAFSCISWPIFFALNTELPAVVDWLLASVTIALAIASIWFISGDIELRRKAERKA